MNENPANFHVMIYKATNSMFDLFFTYHIQNYGIYIYVLIIQFSNKENRKNKHNIKN